MLQTFLSAGLLPTITRPTRVTHTAATLIDNLYIKNSQFEKVFSGILTVDISDHFPIFLFIGKRRTKRHQTVTFQCRRVTADSIVNIKRLLNMTDWNILLPLSVDEQFELFHRKLNEYINICSPIKTITLRPKHTMREKWMTKGLLCSSQTLHKLRRKMTGKCNDDNISRKYRSFRNLYNRLIRISKIAYFSELVETYICNINQTWRVLKTLIGKSHDKTNCRIFEINGAYTENSAEISQSFCNYFTHIGQQCSAAIGQSLKQYNTFLNGNYHISLFMRPSTPNYIITIINKLKPQQSCGHDGISSKLIKDIKYEIATPLSMLINNYIESGIVPDNLKIAKIVQIFKAKETHLVKNYCQRLVLRLYYLQMMRQFIYHRIILIVCSII